MYNSLVNFTWDLWRICCFKKSERKNSCTLSTAFAVMRFIEGTTFQSSHLHGWVQNLPEPETWCDEFRIYPNKGLRTEMLSLRWTSFMGRHLLFSYVPVYPSAVKKFFILWTIRFEIRSNLYVRWFFNCNCLFHHFYRVTHSPKLWLVNPLLRPQNNIVALYLLCAIILGWSPSLKYHRLLQFKAIFSSVLRKRHKTYIKVGLRFRESERRS